MRRASGRLFLCAALTLAAPSEASAEISFHWVPVNISQAAINESPQLANMQCWSLRVEATGDWGSAGFQATLPAGTTFYNHPLGGNTRPNPAFVALFPGLAYDTYVTAPGDTGTSGQPIILGGFPPTSSSADFGGTSGRLSVIWGETTPDAPGTYEILRMTFPQGSLPTVNQDSFSTQSDPTAAGPAGTNLGFPAPYPIKDWLPDADGDWNTPANWSSNSLPQLRQRILLDVGGPELRTITHASGNTELHELRNFERIIVSGGTLSTYVTEINGELIVTGGTFRPLGFNHLTGSGALEVAAGGSVELGTGNALALRSGVTLRGTGGVVTGGIVFNIGGRIHADNPGDVLSMQALQLSLQSGQIGGDGAIRVTGPTSVMGSQTKVGSGVLRVNGTFSIQGSSTLDFEGGIIINDYAGPSPFETIRTRIITGYNNGAWNGTGINSSTAAADQALGVGYAEAAALFTSFPATFAGEQIDDTTLLLRLTRSGDANLDGVVNLQDFNRLAANFGSTNAVWSDGDFNYDGAVNLADFNKLAANFGLSATGRDAPTPEDWFNLAAAIPEPSVPGLLAVMAAPAVLHRRRCF